MFEKWLNSAREVLDIEIEGLEAVRAKLDHSFVQAVEMILACKGRVVVCGLGKSGLVGRKLAATFSSTGTPAFFLHPVEGAHGDLGAICSSDLILAISNSGETDELNAILPALLTLGCELIALTGNKNSTLAKLSQLTIDCGVPREACPLNLAPTASTTAVLAVGDALAVCLVNAKAFTESDFFKVHPGGSLGQRLQLSASRVMQRENLPVAAQSTATAEALQELDRGRLGAVLLVDDEGRLAGILTDGDVRRAVCQRRLNFEAPVREIMTARPLSGVEGQNVAALIDVMEQRQITVLPIVNSDNKPVGIVHLHDLLGKGSFTFARNE